jgi:2-amino-4-hydroxy-6-hydroxymethyldihydropteridine diphosphokinase
LHYAYLNLGSNVDAESNLPRAVDLLRGYGQVLAVSGVWESKSVGYEGPNFLNACVLFLTELKPVLLKEQMIRPIEAGLGRIRGDDKNAPRPIDIDIVLFDDMPLNMEYWNFAFVAVPLAELIPDFLHPLSGDALSCFSERVRSQVWIVPRPDVKI